MKAYRSGRGGSTLRGKANNTKVSAPAPVNLPSRRHEKGGLDSLVASGPSWGSPSTSSTAVLTASSSAASSPAATTTEGANPLSGADTGDTSVGSQGASNTSTNTNVNTSTNISSNTSSNTNSNPNGNSNVNIPSNGDSPLMESSVGSPLQKPAPRAWRTVAHTPELHHDEFPTAAEAAKITQQHDQQSHGHTNNQNQNGRANNTISEKNTTTPNNTVASTAPNTAASMVASEPMSKTVSTLSLGADNWDEADEDEGEDFLNAEAIEFGDGSVILAAAVAQTAESQKDKEPSLPPPIPDSQREERVVDRGDVEFTRAWPNRGQSSSGPSLYQPHQETPSRYGPQDRAHSSLWQGAPTDRRPSTDRNLGHYSHQRRESLGSRDPYQNGPRRDSTGHKDSYSGPRRDPSYREPYSHERRDSYNRSGSYQRDRSPYRQRDGDYHQDRRHSHDRPPYSSDRIPDRQRDFQLLTRPKESTNDGLGLHDINSHGHPSSHPHSYHPHSLSGARGPHERNYTKDHEHREHGGNHIEPYGATDHQHEAMKQIADEARKRRDDEEREREESKARARAKADVVARKIEEEKLAKAKQEAAAEEERLAKEKAEEEIRKKQEQEAAAVSAPTTDATVIKSIIQTDEPEHTRETADPRDRPLIRTMNEREKQEALAGWRALPDKLVKEENERIARIRDERRALAQAEEEKNPVSTVTTPWRRSGNVTMGKGGAKKDDKATSHHTSHEPQIDHLNEVMHKIEEQLHENKDKSLLAPEGPKQMSAISGGLAEKETARSISSKTAGPSAQDTTEEGNEKTSLPSFTERTTLKRNAKAVRAARDSGESTSWRKPEPKVEVATADNKLEPTVNSVERKKLSNAVDVSKDELVQDSNAQAPKLETKPMNGRRISRSMAAANGKGNYPAKLNGFNEAVKISHISKIHARLALQPAGDMNIGMPIVDQQSQQQDDDKPGEPSEGKASGKTDPSMKRGSFLSSNASTIFPSIVEKAAKNRGSVSFMVDSEIDSVPSEGVGLEQVLSSQNTLPTAAAPNKETSADDNAKKAWDATVASDQQQQQQQISGSNHLTPQGVSDMYMVNISGPGGVNPMVPQQSWSPSIGMDLSQAGPAITPNGVVMSGPAGNAAHPGQFPMVMPMYSQGFPMNAPHLYYMIPRGAMPPSHPMPQFPGGLLPPHGSLAMSPRDGPAGIAPSHGSPDMALQVMTTQSVMVDNKPDGSMGNNVGSGASGSVIGPHPHWLPRFSAAGEPPVQAAAVAPAPGAYLVQLPGSQHPNIIPTANRVPQSRSYGPQHHPHHQHQHHPQQQHRQAHHSGPASLESSFQDGSPPPSSTERWGNSNNPTIVSGSGSGSMTSPLMSQNGEGGDRNHAQRDNSNGPSSSLSWSSGNGTEGGNGRMNVNGPLGPTGPFGGYQAMVTSSMSMPLSHGHGHGPSHGHGNGHYGHGNGHHGHGNGHHGHLGGNHRGGRGGFNGGGQGYKELRPRGGYMNQSHHGHQGPGYNMNTGHQQQQSASTNSSRALNKTTYEEA